MLEQQIQALNLEAMEKCQVRIDNLTKPLNSLYYFEVIVKKIAGIIANARPKTLRRKIIKLNKTKLDNDLVLKIFAQRVQANIVNVVVEEELTLTPEKLQINVDKIFNKYIVEGKQIIGLAQNGIDCNADYEQIVAFYLAAESKLENLKAIDQGLISLSILILAAAKNQCLIVLDGLATSLAAMLAIKIAPQVKEYVIASHYASDAKQREALKILDIPAYLYLDMQGDDGVGAALGISLVDASLHMLNDMKTFGEAEVAVANDGPGAEKQDKNVRNSEDV